MPPQIVIVGIGLMGGSLGLALKSGNPDLSIIGVDSEDVLREALALGAIDTGFSDLKSAVTQANIVFLAAPVTASIALMKEMAPYLSAGTIVSDLCSVKGALVAVAAEALPRDVLFVGGHPMTGSERSGIRHADAMLFENATYVVCPPESNVDRSDSYQVLIDLLNTTGARVLELDASSHDRIASRVSHLPQLLSVLLVNIASASRSVDPELLLLAAGGFRDMTRIATSPFHMWKDILHSNQSEIMDALDHFEQHLASLRKAISDGDSNDIKVRFQDAEQTRDFIPTDRKGFLKPLSDVYVFTSDRPGALVDITGSLFRANLSIKDIELLRIRENTGGTFRLGFNETSDADKAVNVLAAEGFVAYRL